MTGTVDERLAAALHKATRGSLEHDEADPAFCASIATSLRDRLADSGVVLVERAEHESIRYALEDMVSQFAYWSDADPPGQITGGLSALEGAFAALGYDEPHPADHLRCDEPGCRKQSSSGTPTLDGYRRTCHEHHPFAAHDAWMTAWRESGLTYSEFVDQQRALRESR